MFLHHQLHGVDALGGFAFAQTKPFRLAEGVVERGRAALVADGHGQVRRVAQPGLGADVVAGCQVEAGAVPEAGVVAGVVVGVADQDIEDHAPEELPAVLFEVPGVLAQDVGQLQIAGFAGADRVFVQIQQGHGAEHVAAGRGAGRVGVAVEAADQQHVLAGDFQDPGVRHGQAGFGGEPHGAVFGGDHVEGVPAGAEFGDQPGLAPPEQHLGPGAADAGAVVQGGVQVVIQFLAAFHPFRRFQGVRQRADRLGAGRVGVRSVGGIQGANAVGAGTEQVVNLPELAF